jgi:hydroxyacylglutathione hydrolase
MPEPPSHYARLKQVNAKGAPIRGCLQAPPSLNVNAFRTMMEQPNVILIDTRSMLAFGGGHIPSAINIGLGSSFPSWAGRMIEPDQLILLITEDAADLKEASEQLFRIGLDNIGGYLYGGMTNWQTNGLPMERTPQMTVTELEAQLGRPDLTVLDVRSDQEFLKGEIPGAQHIFLPHLTANLSQLDRAQTIATYCGSGYRASIAASLLQKHGFDSVVNVPGSWSAWKSKDYRTEKPDPSLVS